MIKKILNPFGVEITRAPAIFVGAGMVSSVVLHVAFYYTLIHFVLKFW